MIEPSIKEVGSIYQEQPDLKTKDTMDQNINKRGQGNVCSLNPMREMPLRIIIIPKQYCMVIRRLQSSIPCIDWTTETVKSTCKCKVVCEDFRIQHFSNK